MYADETLTISPWKRALVQTNITIHMNDDRFYGRVAPRSGLALKNGIHIGAGVVDADYKGTIGVVVFNLSDETFEVSQGMRIAQLIFEKIAHPSLDNGVVQYEERGDQGFGSSGTN